MLFIFLMWTIAEVEKFNILLQEMGLQGRWSVNLASKLKENVFLDKGKSFLPDVVKMIKCLAVQDLSHLVQDELFHLEPIQTA